MTYVQFKHKFHLLHGGGKKKTKLSVGRYYLASTTLSNTSLGEVTIFAGGYKSGGYSADVEVFDKNLVRYKIADLTNARYQLAATNIDNGNQSYALFGGGRKGSTVYKTLDVYNTNFTKVTATEFPVAVYNLAATTIEKVAMFGGGENSSGIRSNLIGYKSSLTRFDGYSLYMGVAELAATTNKYAFFGGGRATSYESKICNRYTSSGTSLAESTNLNVARKQLAATNLGDYVLFGGGKGDGTIYPTVDAFDTSGTRTNPTGLVASRMNLTATSIGYKAFFGGGEVNGSGNLTVDSYNTSLTLSRENNLSVARYGLASASIGYKSIFAGGYGKNPSYSDVVDVYEDTRPDITINLIVPKCVGDWIYSKTPQTISIKAKQGMKYSDLAYSLNNSIKLLNGNDASLIITSYVGQAAVKYKKSYNTATIGAYVSTPSDGLLVDGATWDIFTNVTMLNETNSGFNIGTTQ